MTFSTEITQMLDDCLAEFGRSVTVRQRTPAVWNPTTGQRVEASKTDVAVTMIRGAIRRDKFTVGSAESGQERVAYRGKVSDLTTVTLDEGLYVVDGSLERKVVNVDIEANGLGVVLEIAGQRTGAG